MRNEREMQGGRKGEGKWKETGTGSGSIPGNGMGERKFISWPQLILSDLFTPWIPVYEHTS